MTVVYSCAAKMHNDLTFVSRQLINNMSIIMTRQITSHIVTKDFAITRPGICESLAKNVIENKPFLAGSLGVMMVLLCYQI